MKAAPPADYPPPYGSYPNVPPGQYAPNPQQPQQFYPQPNYPGGNPQPNYPGGYPQQQPMPGHTTIVVPTVPYPVMPLVRDVPISTTCPKCNATVVTHTEFVTGLLTWILCMVIAFFGGFLGCCLIPFCVKGSKDVIHTCPTCSFIITKYNRM